MILGIDGANSGWLVAKREAQTAYKFEYFPFFFSAWKSYTLNADENPDRIDVHTHRTAQRRRAA